MKLSWLFMGEDECIASFTRLAKLRFMPPTSLVICQITLRFVGKLVSVNWRLKRYQLDTRE